MREETQVKLEAMEREEQARRRARSRWLASMQPKAWPRSARLPVLAAVVAGLVLIAVGAGGILYVQAGLLVLGAGFVYFLPALVAQSRKSAALGSIFVVNLFLGWTLIGWVVALAWALAEPPPAAK
jgi:hypothetical protein